MLSLCSRQIAFARRLRHGLRAPSAHSNCANDRLKILLRIIEKDRRLRNFTDVITFALGRRGETFVTFLFVSEVIAYLIALIVLFSDSMAVVLPVYSSDQWKLLGLIFIIPTTFLPLRYLSFSSGLGILSTWLLVAILIFTGLVNPTGPGSIRDPAPTDLWPTHGFWKLCSVFGLLISGFGGHGLIPNLIHDMADPHQADLVCDASYAVAMIVYVLVAVFGYLMYGRDVSDEISKDLARTPGVTKALNAFAVWMVALNPLTKIALGIRPLADMIFTRLGLHKTELVPLGAPTPRYVTRPPSPASDAAAETEAIAERTENTAIGNLIQDGADAQVRAYQRAARAAEAATAAGATGAGAPGIGESGFSAYVDASSSFSRIGYDPAASLLQPRNAAAHARRERIKALTRHAVRLALAVLFVAGALATPSFERVMGLLGSGFASLTLIIIPVWAGAEVFGWRWYHYFAIGVAVVLGTLGTIAAFK